MRCRGSKSRKWGAAGSGRAVPESAVWYDSCMAAGKPGKEKRNETETSAHRRSQHKRNGGGSTAASGRSADLKRWEVRYSEKATARLRKYQREWIKEKCVSVHLHFNSSKDREILEWMGGRKNKTDYIRTLVEEDMAFCALNHVEPEDDKYLEIKAGKLRRRRGN